VDADFPPRLCENSLARQRSLMMLLRRLLRHRTSVGGSGRSPLKQTSPDPERMLISRIEPTLPTAAATQSAAGWTRARLSQHRSRRPAALAVAFAGHAALLAVLLLLIREAVLPEPPPPSRTISMIFMPGPSPTPTAPMPEASAPAQAASAPAVPEPPPAPPEAAAPPAEPSTPLVTEPPPVPPIEQTPLPSAVLPAPPIPPAVEAPPAEPPHRPVVRPSPPRPPPSQKPPEARHPAPARPVAEPRSAPESTPLPAGPTAAAAPSPSAAGAPSLGPTISAAPLPGNSKPLYPLSARRIGEQGRVLIRVSLSASGAPEAVSVATSSGHSALDDAAVNAIRAWRFRPAERNGQPVASTLEVPVTFRLESD